MGVRWPAARQRVLRYLSFNTLIEFEFSISNVSEQRQELRFCVIAVTNPN
jgi:hypothetical protein